MGPSCWCRFRIDCCTSVKLSTSTPSWWSSILYALNFYMPLTEVYMVRPLLALYFVVNLKPPIIKLSSSLSALNQSPIFPVCSATSWGKMILIVKPIIRSTCSIISSILSLLSSWKIQKQYVWPTAFTTSAMPLIVTPVKNCNYPEWNQFHLVLHNMKHHNWHKYRKSRCQTLFFSNVFLRRDSSINMIRGMDWFLNAV